ncbi:MAG: FAD-binding protein, partial [Gammaproteobacteria bacterium]|nr:FAD-binding protein [Gammaproteobacteria bacterium]
MSDDHTQALQAQVNDAQAQGTHLQIEGGGSKSFYGQTITGEVLSTQQHRGIINYEPTELVLTARGGTPLSE